MVLDEREVLLLLNGRIGPRQHRDDPLTDSDEDRVSEASLGLRVGADGRLVDRFLETQEKRRRRGGRQRDDLLGSPVGSSSFAHDEGDDAVAAQLPPPPSERSYVVEVEDALPKTTYEERKRRNAFVKALETKNDELKLRVAGLNNAVKELTEANADLRATLDGRDDELRRCKARMATFVATTTPLESSPVVQDSLTARDRDYRREERRRSERLAEDLAEARRRERRAVDLGTTLRRRAQADRERADEAEKRLKTLREEIASAEASAAKDREAARRATKNTKTRDRALADAHDRVATLQDANAQLESDLSLARRRFAAKKREIDKEKADALRKADDAKKEAQLARDECLALHAKCKSLDNIIVAAANNAQRQQQQHGLSAAKQVVKKTSRPAAFDNKENGPRRDLGAILRRSAPAETSLARCSTGTVARSRTRPAISLWSSDDDDDDDDSLEAPRRRPPSRKKTDHYADDDDDDDDSESSDEKPPPPRTKLDPRFERLRETFDRVVQPPTATA